MTNLQDIKKNVPKKIADYKIVLNCVLNTHYFTN